MQQGRGGMMFWETLWALIVVSFLLGGMVGFLVASGGGLIWLLWRGTLAAHRYASRHWSRPKTVQTPGSEQVRVISSVQTMPHWEATTGTGVAPHIRVDGPDSRGDEPEAGPGLFVRDPRSSGGGGGGQVLPDVGRPLLQDPQSIPSEENSLDVGARDRGRRVLFGGGRER